MAGDPSTVHEFRLFKQGTELGRRTAWQLPVELREAGVGWRVTGSLLCLDHAIGRLSLPRVPTETMPHAPTISEPERQTLTESALALTAFDLTDDVRSSLLAAVQQGRERVLALQASSPDVERLVADMGLDEWRAQALPWTLAHQGDERLASFSLAELASAGGLDPPGVDGIDHWGTSEFARGGGMRASFPVRLPWTTLSGRRGVRCVPALVPDLVIGLAEAAAHAGLPAALTAGLLRVASQDFIETVQTAHADDWATMVAQAQLLARERLEDYVAALTVFGPLVPEREELVPGID